ncbi:MAG: SHOCT domain-containing protein [Acidimicrobiales bacterium]
MAERNESADYPYPPEDVYRATLIAVRTVPGMKVQREDDVARRIEISTRLSPMSWGDRVVLTLVQSDAGTRLSISSENKGGNALGWGSGGHQQKNVARLFQAISQQVSAIGPSQRQASSEGAASADIPDQIKQLADLKDSGVLTEDEFAKKKQELLDRM